MRNAWLRALRASLSKPIAGGHLHGVIARVAGSTGKQTNSFRHDETRHLRGRRFCMCVHHPHPRPRPQFLPRPARPPRAEHEFGRSTASPTRRPTPWPRARASTTTISAPASTAFAGGVHVPENVLVGCADEACAIRGWARSPGHRVNMLRGDVSAYGIASGHRQKRPGLLGAGTGESISSLAPLERGEVKEARPAMAQRKSALLQVAEQLGAGLGHALVGLAAGERRPAALLDVAVLLPAVGRLQRHQRRLGVGRVLEPVDADRRQHRHHRFGGALPRPSSPPCLRVCQPPQPKPMIKVSTAAAGGALQQTRQRFALQDRR